MTISERVLLALSRSPKNDDYQMQDSAIDNALNVLHRQYPNLSTLVSGKRIIDFGCGTGCQSIALVKKFNCSVIGIDTNKKILEKASINAKNHNISSQRLSFVRNISPDMLNNFDIAISHNSFEHFEHPEQILNEINSLLNNSGLVLLTFGLPWFSPYGSHMHFFCKVPWVNILFSEKTVMKVRSNYRNDGALKYEDVESGLNKMTVARFENIVSSNKLKVKMKHYDCIKGMNWLSKLPLLRELFINRITVVLCKAT
jgi:ubiquinone/menaquinone biosynthesis C-methylase UbiE